MPKKKTFWPYGILISIFMIIIACVITIVYASNYPVYEDDFYFEKYQNVKDNYDEIEKKEKVFNENFVFDLKGDYKKVVIGPKTHKLAYVLNADDKNIKFELKKITKNNFDIKDIVIKLTRPHTNKQDKILIAKKDEKISKTNIEIFDVSLPKLEKGRWQIKAKIENENLSMFKSFDLLVE